MDKCNCTLNVLCHIHDINSNRSLFCMEGQNRFLLPTFSSFFQFRCPTLFSTFFIGNFVTFFIFLPFFFVKYHWIILRISAKDVYYIYQFEWIFSSSIDGNLLYLTCDIVSFQWGVWGDPTLILLDCSFYTLHFARSIRI